MELNQVYEIIKQLENVSSNKAKEYILKQNKDNETFKKILIYTYGDYQFGIKKTSINKMEFEANNYRWNDIWIMFEELAKSNINKDLLLKVSNTLGYFEKNIQDLLMRVLLKDLRCNINIKMINKTIPNLIPTHEIMLASKFEGKLNSKVAMTLKIDGIRCSIINEDGNIKFLSRQGKKIEGLNQIENALKEFKLENYVLDGELVYINDDGLSSDDNFRRTTKVVNSKVTDKKNLEFIVFDIVTLDEYNTKLGRMKYEERFYLLDKLIGFGNKYIKRVPFYGTTDNIEDIYKKLEEVIAEQGEGIMLNYLDSTYEFKRSKKLLKVKKFNDADVLVIDILEGEGRLEGKLGKIKIQFKYKNKVYTNFVGSGFSDGERDYYWEHKEELIGKIITIKYFEISKNEKEGIGLRFPTWKGKEYIRKDKDGIDDTNL